MRPLSEYFYAAKNLASYKTGLLTPVPVGYAALCITYACDSRCGMCNIWKRYRENPGKVSEELSSALWVERISESRVLGKCSTIGLTGGEPFLKKGVEEVILAILACGANAQLNSNGFNRGLILEALEKVLKNYGGNRKINVSLSLDGAGRMHDKIRGVKNGFHKVERTLDSLLEMQGHFKNLSVNLCCTIQPKNLHSLDEVIAFAKSKKLSIGFLVMQNEYYFNSLKSNPLREELMKMGEVEREKIFGKANVFCFRKWAESMDEKVIEPCLAGYASISIDPYGEVFPCQSQTGNPDYSMGNIKGKTIDEVWRSVEAGGVRLKARKCRRPCWSGCEIEKIRKHFDPIDFISHRASLGRFSFYSEILKAE